MYSTDSYLHPWAAQRQSETATALAISSYLGQSPPHHSKHHSLLLKIPALWMGMLSKQLLGAVTQLVLFLKGSIHDERSPHNLPRKFQITARAGLKLWTVVCTTSKQILQILHKLLRYYIFISFIVTPLSFSPDRSSYPA